MSKPKTKLPRITCRVRWYDKRDGNGIAYDITGREFYISEDVIKSGEMKDGLFIELTENAEVTTTRCGKDVRQITPSEQTKSLFQIRDSIAMGQAQFASALKQIARTVALQSGDDALARAEKESA